MVVLEERKNRDDTVGMNKDFKFTATGHLRGLYIFGEDVGDVNSVSFESRALIGVVRTNRV